MTLGSAKSLVPAAVIAAVTLVAAAAGLLTPLDRTASDLRTRVLAGEVDSDVVIVAIDAYSLKRMNRWPWSRSVHARLLERLQTADPRAVFFDVDFSVPSGDAAADAALAEVLQQPRDFPVLLPAFWQEVSAGAQTSRMLTTPLPELQENARTALVNVFPGADGLVRETVHVDRFGSREYRSAGAWLAGAERLKVAAAYPVDFRIDPESFDYVSYVDVLEGRIEPARFRGRTIMVGATALELGDNLPVPVHRAIPGVVLQAMIFETLVRGLPQQLPDALPIALMLTVLLAWGRFAQRGWRAQLAFAIGATLFIGAISLLLHAGLDMLLDPAVPLLATVLALFAGVMRSADRQSLQAMLSTLRLKREQALISGVFQASIDGILVLDGDGRIREANPAAARLFDTRRAALIGRSLRHFVPDLDSDRAAERAERLELRAVTTKGERPVELSLSPVSTDERAMTTVIVRDISERKRQQAVLRHQATHDPLTRLPNRTLLNRLLERLNRDGGRAALFMVDLDGFKSVNDTLGHGVGDDVLRILGKRLRQALPADVRVFRIGGDEFAVLVARHAGEAELRRLAQEVLQRIREPLTVGTTRLELGASVGIALFPAHAHTGVMLMQCADVAMYTAKRGRYGIEIYDPKNDHNTLRNLQMNGALREALAAERLSVVYQPKVRLSDGACVGVEALARWQDPQLGNVSPAEFVPLAERSDLIDMLTRFTLGRAIRDHARWCARGIDVSMSVNLSARHLTDPGIVDHIVSAVAEHGLDPSRLELEITETALMEHPERARAVLAQLTRHGIRLAMDDFGTGFSSLAYLKHLNLNVLKIDRCFVQDLEHSSSDRKIVASTLNMAHSLDMEVVAEGIETAGQRAVLAELGCDVGQGFGLGRPMPAHAFPGWFSERHRARPALRAAAS